MKKISGYYPIRFSLLIFLIFISATFGLPTPASAVDSSNYALQVTSEDTFNLLSKKYSAESAGEVYGIYRIAPLSIGTIDPDSLIKVYATGTDAHSYGLFSTNINVATLAGNVESTAENAAQAFGLYADGDADGDNDHGYLTIGDLSGTVTATGINAGAGGLWATGTNGGIINITSLSGTVSATSSNENAYGIYASGSTNITTLSGTVTATASGQTTTERNVYTNGVDSSGGITHLVYNSGATATGIYDGDITIGTLSGTVAATSAEGAAYGIASDASSYSTSIYKVKIGILSGTVSATSLGGLLTTADSYGKTTITAPAYGIYAAGIGINTLSGSVSASSADGTAYGIYSTAALDGGDSSTQMLISGTVKATGATGAYALYADGAANLYITGKVEATATGGTAYAIKTGNSDDSLTLATGADLTGEVDLGAGTDTLTLLGTGKTSTLFSNIENLSVGDGKTATEWIWGSGSSSSSFSSVNIYSGADLELNSGANLNTGSLSVASGGSLTLSAYGQSTAGVTASGAVTLASGSSLNIDGRAEGVGKTSLLISSGSLTNDSTVSVTNPNFSLTSLTKTPTSISATLDYSPQVDAGSLAIASSQSVTNTFADIASSRAENILLAGADSEPQERIMLADASGTLPLIHRQEKPKWNVFAKPVLASTSRDSGSSGEGYDATTGGFTIGMDRFITDDLATGIMVGVSRSQISYNGNSWYDNDNAQQDQFLVGVYGGYRLGAWKFLDTLSFSTVQNETRRRATALNFATADYQSNILRNEADVLYSYELGDSLGGSWELTSKLGLVTTYFYREAYSEDADDNALRYDSFSKTFWEGRFSTRLNGHYTLDNSGRWDKPLQISPFVGAGVIQTLTDNDISVRQYISTTSADVTTTEDDTSLSDEIGVVLSRGPLALTLSYSGRLSENEISHALSGLLQLKF